MKEEDKDTLEKMGKITDENVIEMYDEVAEGYDASLIEAGYKNPEKAVEVFLSKNMSKDVKILDLACGTGIVGQMLKEKEYVNTIGFDGSEKMLKKAEDKKCYTDLIQGMIGMSSFPGDLLNKFDVVIATGMFSKGHVKPQGADDIISALKSGGYAIFSVRDDYVDSLGYMEKFESLQEAGKWKLEEAHPFDNYANSEGHVFLYPSKNKIYVYIKT